MYTSFHCTEGKPNICSVLEYKQYPFHRLLSLHTYVHLQVYDVSGFIDKHPGGARQLLLGAGRDITMVFESYHHFNNSK